MSSASRWLLGTVLGIGGALALVLWLVRPTYDLAYFLPEPVTEPQRVLVERLGQGAGARLIFVEIIAAPGADATEQSAALRAALASSPLLLRIENGQQEISLASIPEPIWRWRFALTDLDWSEAGIRRALENRLADLTTLGGVEISQLISRDPLWSAPAVLERLDSGSAGGAGSTPWSDGSARAFLIAETAAPPFDLAAQKRVVAALRDEYRRVSGGAGELELYGVGVYGAQVQELIQREAQWLGVMASLAVLAIVALAYRSLALTLMSVIPLAAAVLGGMIASSLAFGRIHGITIAFGATLVGVVDDYPMHLFSHARHVAPGASIRLLFRTLLASAGTAIIAYAALAFSGSRGLAQLGVFSLTGVFCALAVTCWVLPRLMRPEPRNVIHDDTPQKFALSARAWLPLAIAALGALSAMGGVRWNDDLGSLTPLPAELLARDRAIRQRFDAPDMRYLVTISAPSGEGALERTEALTLALADARSAGLVASWSAASDLLPSSRVQKRRLDQIPAPAVLAARLESASAGLPFRADAFAPFLADAAAAAALPPMRAADLGGDITGDFVATHLTHAAVPWRSAVFLRGLSEPQRFADWLAERQLGAELVDLKAASETLVGGYRERLTALLGAALALIAALVIWSTRNVRSFVWCAATVIASVGVTLAAVTWLHGAVTLFHMVSLVLVAGLGVDYCLFFSRPQVSRTEFRDTRHAIVACAASTAGAFAILATSSIPLLSAIGTTVAIGTSTMFLAARFGCRAL